MADRLTVTKNDDALLDKLEQTIALIVGVDLPDMPSTTRAVLVGHLTGAVYVTTIQAVIDER